MLTVAIAITVRKMVVLTQFGYFSFFLLSACIVNHSGVPLPVLDSKQIKNVIWLSITDQQMSRKNTLLMKIVQSCMWKRV